MPFAWLGSGEQLLQRSCWCVGGPSHCNSIAQGGRTRRSEEEEEKDVAGLSPGPFPTGSGVEEEPFPVVTARCALRWLCPLPERGREGEGRGGGFLPRRRRRRADAVEIPLLGEEKAPTISKVPRRPSALQDTPSPLLRGGSHIESLADSVPRLLHV